MLNSWLEWLLGITPSGLLDDASDIARTMLIFALIFLVKELLFERPGLQLKFKSSSDRRIGEPRYIDGGSTGRLTPQNLAEYEKIVAGIREYARRKPDDVAEDVVERVLLLRQVSSSSTYLRIETSDTPAATSIYDDYQALNFPHDFTIRIATDRACSIAQSLAILDQIAREMARVGGYQGAPTDLIVAISQGSIIAAIAASTWKNPKYRNDILVALSVAATTGIVTAAYGLLQTEKKSDISLKEIIQSTPCRRISITSADKQTISIEPIPAECITPTPHKIDTPSAAGSAEIRVPESDQNLIGVFSGADGFILDDGSTVRIRYAFGGLRIIGMRYQVRGHWIGQTFLITDASIAG